MTTKVHKIGTACTSRRGASNSGFVNLHVVPAETFARLAIESPEQCCSRCLARHNGTSSAPTSKAGKAAERAAALAAARAAKAAAAK